jgi:hypothetical protein
VSVGALLTSGLAAGRIQQRLRGNRAAYTGLAEPPPAGFQYETAGTPYGGGGFWLGFNASPAVQVGDVYLGSLVEVPGNYALTINSDGTVNAASGPDPTRQSFQYNLYRVASNSLDGGGYQTVWVNDHPPVWNQVVALLQVPVGVPIVPFTVNDPSYAVSPDGDPLTFEIAEGDLPPGITMDSTGLFQGTPTTLADFFFTIIAIDATGAFTESDDCEMNIVPQMDGFRVTAVFPGTYADVYFQEGDVFDIASSADYSDSSVNYQVNGNQSAYGWMMRVAQSTPLFQAQSVQVPAPLFPVDFTGVRTVM